jgi:iron(III) transport system permease protein
VRSFRSFSVLVLALYALLVVAPVVAFAVSALRGGLSAETWVELWRQTTRTNLLRNSLTLSTLTAAAATLLGVPLGFLLARTDVPCRRALTVLCAAPLFLPPFVWATAWQAGLRAHGLSGLSGAVFVMSLALFPVVALLAGVGFAHVDPTLEEDLRTLGGEWLIFRHVTLPLAGPLVATGFLLVFILTLSEFGVPALMQVNVYPVAVYTAFSAFYDFAQAAALCLPFVGIAAVLAFVMHRVTRDVDFASLAEQWQPRCVALGRGRVVAAIIVFALFAAALGVPMAALVTRAGEVHVWQDAREPLLWSLFLSTLGATALTLLGLLVAWLCQRGYARGSAWWLPSQTLLFALPSTIVGLGLVSLWNRPAFAWLYGTTAMIVLGNVARFAPLVVRAFEAFLAQVPKDCEEALWLDGGGVGVTFTRLIVPVSHRAMGFLWAMSFVLCMGELATTILVAPAGIQTLAVRLFTLEANAPQARTASLALVLVAGCLAPLVACSPLFRRGLTESTPQTMRAPA